MEEFKTEKRCLRCRRKLINELALQRGYGSVCYKKIMREKEESKNRGLFNLAETKIAAGRLVKDEID